MGKSSAGRLLLMMEKKKLNLRHSSLDASRLISMHRFCMELTAESFFFLCSISLTLLAEWQWLAVKKGVWTPASMVNKGVLGRSGRLSTEEAMVPGSALLYAGTGDSCWCELSIPLSWTAAILWSTVSAATTTASPGNLCQVPLNPSVSHCNGQVQVQVPWGIFSSVKR